MRQKSKKTQKKSIFRRHIWSFISILSFVCIVFAILFFILSIDKQEKTNLRLHITPPTTQNFTDENNLTFISSDGIPDVNNNRNLNSTASIDIAYNWLSGPYNPAFDMNINDNNISKYISISPLIHGKFTIKNPYTITFTPETPWPAGMKFTVRMSKRLFANDVNPDHYSATFTTKAINATIDSFNVYPAPSDPNNMIGVAIISFNYPIDTDHFSDKVSMRLDDKKINFSVKFDKFHRTAFIISEPIAVINTPQNIRFKLNRVPAMYGDSSTEKITGVSTIDARDNFFRITSVESIIADDSDNNSKQLLLLRTSAPASKATNWSQHINVYLLPQYKDSKNTESNHNWQNDEVTPDILLNSKRLKLIPSEFVNPAGINQYAFAYNVPDAGPRYIYIEITPGAKSNGDFTMTNGLTDVLPVAYPVQSVKIAGSGAILSMSGDKKLGIMTRGGVHNAYVKLYKIKSTEINHLISQTYNVFSSDIEFKSWSFGTYDMSVVFEKRIPLNVSNAIETNYASLDLGDYMDRVSNDKTGVFIIQAGTSENDANFNDQRLIIVTNLGIIRKVNTDGTSSLFISNISDGKPAADVEINILGRNGNSVWAGRTDTNGYANIPALPWKEYKNARAPVAIIARLQNDISFIPYDAAHSQHVEYSKFDIDGVYSYTSVPLNAFIFTDRGIYRPGETAIIGTIIKNKSFKSLDGIPVRISILDPRGRTITEKNISLHADGMLDTSVQLSAAATIGEYTVNVYSLNVRSKPQDLLGTTTFQVAEFVPDTMKITATINNTTPQGWIKPDSISTDINLRNLFGTPAAERRIKLQATLIPMEFKFDDYSQYDFTLNSVTSNAMSQTSPIKTNKYTKTIDNLYTDSNGFVHTDVKFDTPIPNGTYLLTTTINGYEPNSGKSVQTTLTARTSNAQYLVGRHTTANLSYINRNSTHSIDFIALDNTAQPTTVENLTVRFIRREKLTSLVKDYNNYYKYQTTTRDVIALQDKLEITTKGTSVDLVTNNPGTYFIQILDENEKTLSTTEYIVISDENIDLTATQSAELEIKLNSSTYLPGDNIQVNITAPYAGYGLITIERDRIYAHKWFNMSNTSSTQTIQIPSDFEGTGYINVSFIRAIDSHDIFTSPYTYSVAPFSTNMQNRTIAIALDTPKIIRDHKLNIEYKSNQTGRMMLFAIDEGILQVSRFKTPSPLEYFFAKSALQVETFQILSLILPEYKILREFAKTGGGDFESSDSELLSPLSNPFSRRTSVPVAFYSGILDVTANTTGSISFDIPDNFNGSIRIFAVITNDNAVGAAQTETTIQNPLVISVSAPTFIAPGDKFEINALVGNMTDIGSNINIQTDTVASDNIAITSGAYMESNIKNGDEHLFIFKAQSQNTPGISNITVNASATNDNGLALINRSSSSTISIRPTTTIKTQVKTALIDHETATIKRLHTDMYPENAVQKLYISNTPAVLIKPLFEYLSKYEFTCTEQLVSQTIPYVLLSDSPILGTDYNISATKINDTINTLKNRQKTDGSFDLWDTSSTNQPTAIESAELTTYVVQFLSMARKNGFNVPDTMLGRAIDFLRNYAASTITSPEHARAMAYAIYVITANGYVTTSYIDKFQEYSNQYLKNWDSEISGVYIAASYNLMHQADKAIELISKYKLSKSGSFKYLSTYDNNVSNDATYLYISSSIFNSPATNTGNAISAYINRGNYDTYTSAKIIMGLNGFSIQSAQSSPVTIFCDDTQIPSDSISNTIIANIPLTTQEIRIDCPSCSENTLYYALIQQGFEKNPKNESNGIEITRTYYDAYNNRITSASLGDIVTVKISARARGTDILPNVAIIDLLPGGFIAEEVIGNQTFSEIREDRVIIYTDLTRSVSEFTYRAQISSAGTFAISPIYATSMYNPDISATTLPTAKNFSVMNQTDE